MYKIYLGADHQGVELKKVIREFLETEGYEVEDCGNSVQDPMDDYPDFIHPVAQAVAADPENRRGVIFGRSGQGEAITANRHKGVRAALYAGGDEIIVRLSREHNDANVLSLGAGFVSPEDAKRLTKLWLETPSPVPPEGARHLRRIGKIDSGM